VAKRKKPAKKQLFRDEFVFIVDATGSMGSSGKRDEAEAGVNGFLDEQANVEGEAVVSIILFHSNLPGKMQKLADRVDVNDIRLSRSNYRLGGMTPLYEACIRTIEGLESDADSVTVIIATDGLENASAGGFTKQRLAQLIQAKTATGWNFIFLGQDIDAAAEGAKIGTQVGTTAQTTSYERALKRTSAKVTEFRATRNAERLIYSDEDRSAIS
jgi:Mg-chelatase subunit ChlD